NARQLLQMETGIPLSHVDFVPAREPDAETPLPTGFGFDDHAAPNALANAPLLVGLQYESDAPLPFATLLAGGNEVGRGLHSLYSPACKGAITLGHLPQKYSAPGTTLTARGIDSSGARDVSARVVPLPFL